MGLFDDIKAKADVNGDGKITPEDLEALKDGANNEKLDQLKGLADQNGDGKIDLADIKGFKFDNVIDNAKDKFGGLFGGK